MKISIPCLLFACLVITGCTKSPTTVPNNNDGAGTGSGNDSGVDIYVSGTSYIFNGNSAACYWKNGVLTNLTGKDSHSGANAIFVKDNDVYVAGYTIDPVTKLDVATYWKNGEAHVLKGGDAYTSFGNAITVAGTDVYVAGYTTQPGRSTATYWKNGIRHDLPSDKINGHINAIAVVGSDVYAGGYTDDIYYTVEAVYWKNDVLHNLSPNSNYGMVDNVAISGADVYFGGFFRPKNKQNVATYWKNDLSVQLVPDTTNSYNSSIAVSGTEVYFGGSIQTADAKSGGAYYWKDGQSTRLPELAKKNEVMGIVGIAKINSDLYMAESIRNSVNNTTTGAFWINDKQTPLIGSYNSSDNSNLALVTGIAVVKH